LKAALPAVSVVELPANLGFSGGSNRGITAALRRGAELILLMNSDAVLDPDAIGRLEDALAANPDAGIAGAVLLSQDRPGEMSSAGIAYSSASGRMIHPEHGRVFDPSRLGTRHDVDAVSGCVMLVRKEVFERVGLFDERFFFSFEDIDFCLRARRAGFRSIVAGEAVAYHAGSRSIGPRSPRKMYFATRNHLLAAKLSGDRRFPGHGALRASWIVALNAAGALRSGGVPRIRGLSNVALGSWHHLTRRYGDGP
jgi:GT2 family glycosyltransferase